MPGMDAATGRPLGGIAHLRQSVRDVLTTRVGTRTGRRTYGSGLPELADRPLNAAALADVYAATVEALSAWEPRFKLESVAATSSTSGHLVLDLTGRYLPDGGAVSLSGIVIS